MREAISVECWNPSMCESKKEETTNTTTSVQFDKIISPVYTDKCKYVEKK